MKKVLISLAMAIAALGATGCQMRRSWTNPDLCCSPYMPSPCDECAAPPPYSEGYLAPPSVEVMPGPVVN